MDCAGSTLTELRRLADEVVLDRAEAMKDPKKRQVGIMWYMPRHPPHKTQ